MAGLAVKTRWFRGWESKVLLWSGDGRWGRGLVWGKSADARYKLPQDGAGKPGLPPRSDGWSRLRFVHQGLLVLELSQKRGFLTARCLWHHTRGFQPFPQLETCNISQGSPACCPPQTHLLGCPAPWLLWPPFFPFSSQM